VATQIAVTLTLRSVVFFFYVCQCESALSPARSDVEVARARREWQELAMEVLCVASALLTISVPLGFFSPLLHWTFPIRLSLFLQKVDFSPSPCSPPNFLGTYCRFLTW
jgi:hypothetical protein